MFLRAIIPAVLALVLLSAPFALRPAFPQTDNDAAPSAIRSEAGPTDTTPTSPVSSSVEAAKPKPRVKPKRPPAVNAQTTGGQLFRRLQSAPAIWHLGDFA